MVLIFKLVLLTTAFLMALISGLFYAYSCSVNIGLGRLTDTEYLRAMQSINRAILNPWFFASFMGTLVMMPICTWLAYKNGGGTYSFYLLLAATIIYAIGVFGVTGLGNVPLNESLDKFDIGAATLEEIKARRLNFEIPWNRFHLIRTVANALSLVLVLMAMIKD
jgi:uncharacterized membrane protein